MTKSLGAAVRRAESKATRRHFVAGVLGPTNKTASLSPDVNDPGFRAVTFDELVAAYGEALQGLLEGGVDLLLVETIFDTLNAKAALFAIEDTFARVDVRLPVIISGTITDASGRTLSGQTTEAFYNSVRHTHPLAVGLNCALGAKELRPYVEELARLAETSTSCHPNAGLPNAFGEYDDTPEAMAAHIGEWARNGWLNIVGGCCGTTPEHIRAMGDAVAGIAPRAPAERPRALRLSGLEPLNVDEQSLFVNVGERTNVTGSKAFARLILAGDFAGAQGDLSKTDAIVWSLDRDTPYVPSPLLYDGILYFLKTNSGILSAFDARTGKPHYQLQRLDGVPNVFASPVGAKGRVYLPGREGVTLVIKHGPAYEVLASNKLNDGFDASPALVENVMYMRGYKNLYAISAP